MQTYGFIQHDKYQQVAGSWLKLTKYGTMQNDTVTFNTGAESVKMTPSSATIKLQGDLMQVPVASGKTCTPTIYVRKGTSYNGNQMRLIVKANAAMGITSDTVLATGSVAIGTWEALSAATVAVSQNGMLDFFVDCDGTAGTANYDTFSAVTS